MEGTTSACGKTRNLVSRNPSHWFAEASHSANTATKIASTVNENGGHAITISANPNHAARFLRRNRQPCCRFREIATAIKRAPAPA
jgi:hypothetical protein